MVDFDNALLKVVARGSTLVDCHNQSAHRTVRRRTVQSCPHSTVSR